MDVRDWEKICLISAKPASLSENESTRAGCGEKRERQGGSSSTEASKKIEDDKKCKKAKIK